MRCNPLPWLQHAPVPMRFLLVEDDSMIGESLEEGLRTEGYAVDWVRDGASAELALAIDVYDLVLLDLGLPRKAGLELLSGYRSRGGAARVLIITARDALPDRIRGLDAGADDYLVKPFDIDELYARIRALLRRQSGSSSRELKHLGLVVDLTRRLVTFEGRPLEITARQFAVLYALMDPPGHIVTRSQLEDKLYGWNEEVESNTVDVFIFHLRRKLGADFIKTVRGVGFRLADES